MTETDPVAELQATVFRQWALVATNARRGVEAVAAMVAEWAYKENPDLILVCEDAFSVAAGVVGAPLSAGDFLLMDADDNVPAEPTPEQFIAAACISFREETVPEPKVPGGESVVHIRLQPDHPVQTGEFTGPVFAGKEEVARPAVYVSGKNP